MTTSNDHPADRGSLSLDFEPVGRRGQVDPGRSIGAGAHQLGVGLISLCGGSGTCGGCRVQVADGRVSAPSENEKASLSPQELSQGWRLACQTYPAGNVKLIVPPESLSSPQRVLVEGRRVPLKPEPVVDFFPVRLDPAIPPGPNGDADRLLAALGREHHRPGLTIDLEVVRSLSSRLMSGEQEFRVGVRGREIMALGPWPQGRLGLAVDLGTTKIAAFLVDLDTGRTLAARGSMNPQIAVGEDVMTRITRALRSPAEALRLQELAVAEINRLALELCTEPGAAPEDILEAVLVGNTPMHHLFLGLPVARLGLAPYPPAITGGLDVRARELGLNIAPGAYIHLPPNIAGFVGGDHVAMLLAAGVQDDESLVLALDIGTNTEICLAGGGSMTSVSCASGPAFEGAHIKFGMRAGEGAIERLRLRGRKVEYQTVGGSPPAGLCGSGILDALAQLFLGGVLDAGGRMVDRPGVRLRDGLPEFVLVDDDEREGRPALTITQRDVRELQLAKGAVRAGIDLLLELRGRGPEEIDKVLIAGAFGSYIDVKSAVTIGMFPALPLERFDQIGNAAGLGARQILVSKSKRAESQALARRTGYFELAGAERFAEVFARSMGLGNQ